MNYETILQDIAKILEEDYAGCHDKREWIHPSRWLEALHMKRACPHFNDLDFYVWVNQILKPFQDSHLFFNRMEGGRLLRLNCGFEARAYKDGLFVTKVLDSRCSLDVGTLITEIDSQSTKDLKDLHNPLQGAKSCRVKLSSGIVKDHILEYYPLVASTSPCFEVMHLSSERLLIRVPNFYEPDTLNALLKSHEMSLKNAKALILDLRNNPGGTDVAFFQLLGYCFDTNLNYAQVDDEVIAFNMTERNYQLRMPRLQKCLASCLEAHEKLYYKRFIDFMNANRGGGFKTLQFYDPAYNEQIQGQPQVKSVVILTDVACASAGESFVLAAKKSDKVTVIGRPTAGAIDYCNLAEQVYDQRFSLKYPTSRSTNIDLGKALNGKGIQPDILVPWHPTMLTKDLDLEMAVAFLDGRLE